MGWIILIVLLLCSAGAFPAWPHATGWGYYPFSGFSLVAIVLLILLLSGRL